MAKINRFAYLQAIVIFSMFSISSLAISILMFLFFAVVMNLVFLIFRKRPTFSFSSLIFLIRCSRPSLVYTCSDNDVLGLSNSWDEGEIRGKSWGIKPMLQC